MGIAGRQPLLWSIFTFAAAALIAGLMGLDEAIAGRLAGGSDPLGPVVAALDLAALKNVSNFLLGAVIVAAGAIGLAFPAFRRTARLVLYVGVVQFAATTIADLAKPPFGRLRPFEAFEAGKADTWFVGANSFPSGHVGFYAGLILPLIVLWPRAWPLLLLPALVAAQRVLSLDHYLSDVAAALAVSALAAILLRPIAGRAVDVAASSRSKYSA